MSETDSREPRPDEPVELPTGYYLDNFQTLLDFVDELYGDILSEEERRFSSGFRTLDLSARRLFVRLLMRKGPVFRSDKLHYPEIGEVTLAAASLESAGLLCRNHDRQVEEVARLLLRHELIGLLEAEPKSGREQVRTGWSRYRKEELLDRLLGEGSTEILAERIQHLFDWYELNHLQIVDVYRLLFFGNLGQDLTEFVLLDLGLVRYERYLIHRKDRLFTDRDVLARTLEVLHLREACCQALEMEDLPLLERICDALPEALGESSIARRRDRILNAVGRFCERRGDLVRALDYYGRASAPPARERFARVQDKLGDAKGALDVCESILAEPREDAEVLFANMFRAKMQKKLGLEVHKPKRLQHPDQTLLLERKPGRKVEEAVLIAMAEKGIPGFYAENRFWLSLFGLAFWDIVFLPVRGAFFNRYQRGPMGTFSSEFRKLRLPEIERRLEECADRDRLERRVLETHDEKQGIANYFVAWHPDLKAQVRTCLGHVPGPHLALIFDRLSRDPGEYRSGFPDLLLFPDSETYMMAEVKGPGDQLQHNQRGWLRYFAERGLPYKVIKVKWLS
ncbi:Fanconi-associated nuclease [Sulfidibacter corallicola]|uniref:phosphodiesterase I n=1 Tax=Sulfidibacter corallicola TaxID=2818388 RepID=A0A8A4TSH5_SULCO|nr:VRR-NUC domain-containing protein [Sulfidibacter corallicola]QTD51981.1 VRR-NUC domain-containing protein [Sulfidibacter corallicola]